MKQLIVVIALTLGFSPVVVADGHADEQKAILVTGASTGIGRNIAETLAAEGYFVYAGARKQEDLDALNAIDNIMAVRLDVTVQEEIDAAVETIRAEGRGLYGLVNNAGVATFGPLTQTPDSDLHFVFNVNVAGVLRTTRAFAPMILESQGRIVTTGSISGTLSSPMGGVYSMSKHAVEAFTDSLAGELGPQGVHVAVVEPGNYRSRIRETTVNRISANMEAAGIAVPEEQQQQMDAIVAAEQTMNEPDDVSAAVMHALFSDAPQRRYMVVPVQGEAEITIRKKIEELVQLNGDHQFSYSRDELVQMLDEALAPAE
ncbi:MAG: SDR family oxidoreductase [Woeseiaceae bacterium]|nr:SDR family oxidoreductase [Woeseiaceae bacterium]